MTHEGKWSPNTAVAAPTSVAVDRSALVLISRGKPDVERELVALFRRLNDEDIDTLQRAVSEGDVPGAVVASHRISGAGRMIGAIGLAEVCEGLEIAGRAGDLSALRANMAVLHLEAGRVNTYLDSM